MAVISMYSDYPNKLLQFAHNASALKTNHRHFAKTIFVSTLSRQKNKRVWSLIFYMWMAKRQFVRLCLKFTEVYGLV